MDSKRKSENAGKWRRFRRNPRAMVSLIFLAVLYAFSLCTELICSSEPLYLRVRGRSFFPFLSFVSERELFGEGADASPDWSRLEDYQGFSAEGGDFAIYAPVRSGTSDVMRPSDFEKYRKTVVTAAPQVKVARCDVDSSLRLTGRHYGCESFFDTSDLSLPLPSLLGTEEGASEKTAPESISSEDLRAAVASRLANNPSPAASFTFGGVKISLAEFKPRSRPPKSVRLRIEETGEAASRTLSFSFDPSAVERSRQAGAEPLPDSHTGEWNSLPASLRAEIVRRLSSPDSPAGASAVDASSSADSSADPAAGWNLSFAVESVTWPFRPVPGHPMGIDANGRDVFACVLSGTRTAMTFGILLVAWAMLIGIVAGALQGYFAGWVDMAGQRFIEIWSSLPFLYVMILVGDVLGRSFGLLLFCYGLFNWIGISYYVRAEFLRLRKRPFVEAAKCLGLSPRRIILRHILPNALTPVITLLPFSLVGAIASISALDFLGFGLPPLTPSWGGLLQQAQDNVQAWWLILYPSAMLFLVMLAAVFVGEGLRDAFDPKPSSRYR